MSRVLIESTGATRTLTLNRAEKRNALASQMLEELLAAFSGAATSLPSTATSLLPQRAPHLG